MKLSPEYFENRAEQAQIKEAIERAIPRDVLYQNLIIALSEMLASLTHQAFEDEAKDSSLKVKSTEEHDAFDLVFIEGRGAPLIRCRDGKWKFYDHSGFLIEDYAEALETAYRVFTGVWIDEAREENDLQSP